MSSRSFHNPLAAARKPSRSKSKRPDNLESNLEVLGLLPSRQKESKRKGVEFSASVSDASSSTRRPSRAPSRSNNPRLTPDSDRSSAPSHLPRSSRGMAGVLDMERSRNRKDRTFVGSECAVCEENLEYTLRGERILQLSCGHVAHEACFYEHIRESESQYCPACKAPLALDTSRGGNVLDLEKLSYIVKSGTGSDGSRYGPRSNMTSPVPWDNQPLNQPASREPTLRPQRSQELLGNRERVQQHSRNDSATTGVTSVNDFAEPQSTTGRRHDYDVQSMETSLSSPRNVVRNPIPPPTVTVRSEFPTLTRSRQQQSLTCLITVEVMEGKWRPTPEDVRPLPPVPQQMGSLNEFGQKTAPVIPQRSNSTYESRRQLDEVTEELHSRVDNWHGLDFSRFGKLRLHGYVRVGKDQKAWQDLDCYLFSDMLICVRERKPLPLQESYDQKSKPKCTLKGSILIKKHLKEVETHLDRTILTLSLSVAELPQFHLQFQDRSTLEVWKGALLSINSPQTHSSRTEYDFENSGTDEDEYRTVNTKRLSSVNSSYGAAKSYNTAPTEYSSSRPGMYDPRLARPIHVPLDIVVVIPVSTSMQGLKISLLRDTLKFLVTNLGERDRMGLVTFGSSGGGVPIVSMTSKAWNGWAKVLDSVRPVGQKSLRADVVEGANVAMDLLMQRKSANPLSSILLISDSSTSDPESVDFVIQRAEAAKVVIHSFGLGLTHKPDTMIELSTRTKASYTYVKDWMMLRECVAGCLGSLQTTSHQNAKLKLRLPEGSPAKFVKISGALHITKRASGRDAEAALGDLRFGDKRDILVQLVITPDNASAEQLPQDHWGTIISDLESIGGSADQDEQRTLSVEEVPLIQADLTYGDILRDGAFAQLSRPSLLAITMLPASRAKSIGRPISPPIPPHPSIVQRRMELLTSDMLTRALMLVSKGQHDRAHHLLRETRSILKGLGKGNLPPLPTPGSATTGTAPPFPSSMSTRQSALPPPHGANQPTSPTSTDGHPDRRTNNSPPTNASQLAASPTTTAGSAHGSNLPPLDPTATSMSGHNSFQPSAVGIDTRTVAALDAELEASLEWISHPAIFGRDSRKAVLQAIGVISSQRGYTFRTPAESLWAERIKGIKRLAERSREWREVGDEMAVVEEG